MSNISISNLRAIAWHLEQGQDNGGITKEALALQLRSVADELETAENSIDAIENTATMDHKVRVQTISIKLTIKQRRQLKYLFDHAHEHPYTGFILGQMWKCGYMTVGFATPQQIKAGMKKHLARLGIDDQT